MRWKILFVEDDLDLQELVTDFFTEKSEGELELTCAVAVSSAVKTPAQLESA